MASHFLRIVFYKKNSHGFKLFALMLPYRAIEIILNTSFLIGNWMWPASRVVFTTGKFRNNFDTRVSESGHKLKHGGEEWTTFAAVNVVLTTTTSLCLVDKVVYLYGRYERSFEEYFKFYKQGKQCLAVIPDLSSNCIYSVVYMIVNQWDATCYSFWH